MSDTALRSDHINYLIFRYLQEAGFQDSATSLYKEWYRAEDLRDPESFPFASSVKQHELIRIVQDGIFFDQMQARVASSKRKYTLVQPMFEFKAPIKQRTMSKVSSRRQSTTPSNQDEFPLPPPKRSRQSEPVSEVVTNGDAMDVDEQQEEEEENDDDDEEDEEEGNITLQSDQDQSESHITQEIPPIETKTVATQTEKVKSNDESTLYLSLEDMPSANILHAHKNQNIGDILLGGEGVVKLFHWNMNNSDKLDPKMVSSRAFFHMEADDIVTAMASNKAGEMICAIRSRTKNGVMEDDCSYRNILLHFDYNGVQEHLGVSVDDIITCLTLSGDHGLKDSRKGYYIVGTNGTDSLISFTDADFERSDVHAILPDTVIVDMLELGGLSEPNSVAICGQNKVSIWQVPMDNDSSRIDPDNRYRSQAFIERHMQSFDHPVDFLRYHASADILFCVSVSTCIIDTLVYKDDSWTVGTRNDLRDWGCERICDLVKYPLKAGDGSDKYESLFAVACVTSQNMGYDDSGVIYLCKHDEKGLATRIATLQMAPHQLPLVLAFSDPVQSGSDDKSINYLASASDEAVCVWEISQLEKGSVGSMNYSPKTVLDWRASASEWYQSDDNNLPDDSDSNTVPKLCWMDAGHLALCSRGNVSGSFILIH